MDPTWNEPPGTPTADPPTGRAGATNASTAGQPPLLTWMSRRTLSATLLVVILAAGLFHACQREIRGAWLFGIHPEVLRQLESALLDLKALARLDPGQAGAYKQRFESLATLVQRLRVLEHNRAAMALRYEGVLFVAFAAGVVALLGLGLYRHQRDSTRLLRLQDALAGLAHGRLGLRIGDRSRDTIGRLATMIERTSKRMARDQQRLKALNNLSAWQEAARRHAHEMRTPLTGARLELDRLGSLLTSPALLNREEVLQGLSSVAQELDRLGRFTRQFTSFARLPRPQLAVRDLSSLVQDFVTTFATAWPALELVFVPQAGFHAAIDADMVRQVLVNLCDNSALAVSAAGQPAAGRSPLHLVLGRSSHRVTLDLEDQGPGIPQAIRARLFEPYTTTRSIGEGMGLGLAICRKILLDHGGDLELLRSSAQGTTFRLVFQPSLRVDASITSHSGIPS